MNQIPRPVTWLYALMVNLFPRSFRAEFKEEMTATFAQAIAEAAERGGFSLAAMLRRELYDLGVGIVLEWWCTITKQEVNMPPVKKPEWFFYPSWVLLTTISIPVAWIITWIIIFQVVKVVGGTVIIDGRSHITEDWLGGYILIPTLGLVTGLFQYLLLRRYLSQMGWWVVATALSLPLAAVTVSFLGLFLPEGLDTNANWFVLLMIALVGGIISFMQWLVLRRHFLHAGWWIPATIAGWMAVRLAAGPNLTGPLDIMVFGILPACATAVALALLMYQPPPPELQNV